MKITGKNTAVGTSAEDIITAGSTLTEPTTNRIHAIVSASALDDNDGIKQVETATVAGTVGASGAGNASVLVTGALVTGSPLTVPVAVANNDTAAQVAGKIRTALGALAAITDNYTVSGSTTAVILTAKAEAANDSSLNIAVADGTSSGVTTAATSANTTAGVASTAAGARTVEIIGVNLSGAVLKETVALNGTTPVNTSNAYAMINSMEVKRAGSLGSNQGAITATAATDSTVTAKIEAGKNKSQYAVCGSLTGNLSNLKISALNATADAITYVDVLVKKLNSGWMPVLTLQLSAVNPVAELPEAFYTFSGSMAMVKIQATASAGSSSVVASFDFN